MCRGTNSLSESVKFKADGLYNGNVILDLMEGEVVGGHDVHHAFAGLAAGCWKFADKQLVVDVNQSSDRNLVEVRRGLPVNDFAAFGGADIGLDNQLSVSHLRPSNRIAEAHRENREARIKQLMSVQRLTVKHRDAKLSGSKRPETEESG